MSTLIHSDDWSSAALPTQDAALSVRATKCRKSMERVPPRLPTPTIFHESWWLEAASGGTYREAVISSDNRIVARLPYLQLRKPTRQTALIMPPMTHALGPALAADVLDNHSLKSLRSFSLVRQLIAELPRSSYAWFKLHRGTANTLAFEAAGFSSGVEFTVEIAPDSPDALWRRMRDKTRNVIRRAQEQLTVVETFCPAEFVDFYEDNLREKGLRNNYDGQVCRRLVTECLRRGAGRLLVAVDPTGAFKAGVFTIWDDEVEYYFMSTRTLDSGNGATSLLIWSAIQHASLRGLIFDLDGINAKANLLLLTGFGGTLKPRFFVHRASVAFQMAQRAGQLLGVASRR